MDDRYCDWSVRVWMILHHSRPQRQSLQKESSSYKANLSWRHLLSRPSSEERGKNRPKTIPFKTIWLLSRPCRPEPCHSITRWNTSVKQIIWTPGPWCLTAPRHVKHPHHHQQCHPLGTTHLGLNHFHHQHHFHPESHQLSPAQRTPHPEGRQRHQSEPAFIRPRNVDQGLTPGLSALLAETSPLAPYRLQRQAKAKAQNRITTHKWVISRPFGSFQDHHVFYIDLHGQFS